MERIVNDRIKMILDYFEVTPNEVDRELGLYRGTTYNVVNGINGKRSKPSHDYTVKILKRFPEVDANWLMMEDGNMFKPDKGLVRKEIEEKDKIAQTLFDEKCQLVEELTDVRQQLTNMQFMVSLVRQNQSQNQAVNFKFVSKKSPVYQQFIIKKRIVVNSLVNSVS